MKPATSDPRFQHDLTFRTCDFVADYANSPPPFFQVNGSLGAPGFNVQLISSHLSQDTAIISQHAAAAAHPDWPGFCPAWISSILNTLQALELHPNRDGPNNHIALGQPIKGGNSTFTFQDRENPSGPPYVLDSSQGVFEFTLTGLDPVRQVATGTFRQLISNSDDSLIIFANGTFVMPIKQ